MVDKSNGTVSSSADAAEQVWWCADCDACAHEIHFLDKGRSDQVHYCPRCRSEYVYPDGLLACDECGEEQCVMPGENRIGKGCTRTSVWIDEDGEDVHRLCRGTFQSKKPRVINYP